MANELVSRSRLTNENVIKAQKKWSPERFRVDEPAGGPPHTLLGQSACLRLGLFWASSYWSVRLLTYIPQRSVTNQERDLPSSGSCSSKPVVPEEGVGGSSPLCLVPQTHRRRPGLVIGVRGGRSQSCSAEPFTCESAGSPGGLCQKELECRAPRGCVLGSGRMPAGVGKDTISRGVPQTALG